MERRPVFLFAFANDKKETLNLNDEWRRIVNVLYEAHEFGLIEMVPNPKRISGKPGEFEMDYTKLEDLFDHFDKYHNRIHVFHFAGHSGPDGLSLADVHFKKLEHLLGKEENIKVVFLNGCENMAQVDKLHHANVPAVIATREEIDDDAALKFAGRFYSRFAVENASIDEAFKIAKDFIDSRNYGKAVSRKPRKLGFGEVRENEMPWGLYWIEGKENILDWKIERSEDYKSYLKVKSILEAREYDKSTIRLIRNYYSLSLDEAKGLGWPNVTILKEDCIIDLRNLGINHHDLKTIGDQRFNRCFGDKF